MMLRFERWLKMQKKRNDPIGDLSKDYIITGHKGKLDKYELDKWSACQRAYEALIRARWEYRKFMREEK